MANKTKKIKENIEDTNWMFEQLVATPYGSLIQTHLILNGITWTNEEFVKRMKKADFPFMDDKEYIKKTLENVGLNYIDIVNKPVALCEGKFNTVFCPFVVADDEIVLLPLFSDRHYLHTQEEVMANDTYKIIDWSNIEEEISF